MLEAAAVVAPTVGRRAAAVLGLMFLASGAAALVYEVAWFHLLRLAIGSSAVSVAFLLGGFMGGMCLGSCLLPRWAPLSTHPLLVYATLEAGIGAFGLWFPSLLPHLGEAYAARGDGSSLVLRGAFVGLALLPPTALMGATLPVAARLCAPTPPGLAQLGRFYGCNIFGAVVGAMTAGFWLLRIHDVGAASFAAAMTNFAVAVLAVVLAKFTPTAAFGRDATPPPAQPADAGPAGRRLAMAALLLSGFTALGAEIVWTRQLSLLLGATTYAFSLILAVFLIGLGIGSWLGARSARRGAGAFALGLSQLLLAPAILWGAFAITHVLPLCEPTWLFQPRVYQNAPLRCVWDMLRCGLAMLPATLLWGASFPLGVAAAVGGRAQEPGRLVGGLYAANTLGAILGALGVGLFGIAAVGTQACQRALVLLAGAAAMTAWLEPRAHASRRPGPLGTALAAAALLMVALCAKALPRTPDGLIAFGRSVEDWDAPVEYLCVAEGQSASVAVSEFEGYTSFHVSGKVVASTQPLDMRLQRLLGHLPSLLHGAPRSVLIVGCGAGVTAGCFCDWPTVERIVVCEIEPKVVAAARMFLGEANRGVLDDPRTTIVLDDARHYLATTQETFDVITSDPIHPWVRGAAALYSSEYYGLVQKRLRPGGVVTQWVPLYQTDEAAVKSQLGTFAAAFADMTLWNSDPDNKGYDLVALGRRRPGAIDMGAVQWAIDENPLLRGSLGEIGLGSALDLLSCYCGDGTSLQGWLADAQRNVDASLRLQYLAGLRLDVYRDHEIFAAIRNHGSWPEGRFLGEEHEVAALRDRLAR